MVSFLLSETRFTYINKVSLPGYLLSTNKTTTVNRENITLFIHKTNRQKVQHDTSARKTAYVDILKSSLHVIGCRVHSNKMQSSLSNKTKIKVTSAYEPRRPIRPALSSGFRGMKRLGVFLLPPGWDASPSQGYPQH